MSEPDFGVDRRIAPAGEDERLRSIVDHVADGIVIVDDEGEIRFVNPAAASLFGRAASDLLGRPFGFPVLTEEPAEIEILRPDGAPVVGELRATELEWEDESCLLIALREVTDRKEAEERRRELIREQAARERAEDQERRSRFLADAGAVLDSSLEYSEVLSQLARLLVRPQSELPTAGTGRPHHQLAEWCAIDVVEDSGELARVAAVHHDAARQPLLDELVAEFPPDWTAAYPALQALRTGQPLLLRHMDRARLEPLTRSAKHADLLERIGIASVIAVPLVARREVLGAVTLVCAQRQYDQSDLSFARELAERAALAIANARLYRAAQQANRAKSEFLGVMSHELRTPLNAIIGYADLMQAGVSGAITPMQEENLKRIGESSRHLLRMVEEILTYSRMEAGREEFHPERVDLGRLVSDVCQTMEPLAAAKSLRLKLQNPERPLAIESDPGKLRQILLNLLDNAVKFTDRGGIDVSVIAETGNAIVEVSDTGRGIHPDHVKQVFEPFWQVEQSATRSVGGTGLGLSVARRLAELLGGSLTLRSTPSTGSTFRLTLPGEPSPAGGDAGAQPR